LSNNFSIYDALDDIRKQYSVVLTTLSAETYRADMAEGEAFATNLRLVEALKELESIKASYRGSPSDLLDYKKMTNEECNNLAKAIGDLQ
jgi:DNA repair ATPase RecN